MEKLILLRGATSVVEFDFSAFEFYDEGFCQFVMKRKINDDVICRLDFKERKKYYVTFKDEFTAGLDRDEYRFDIMLMLEDERYRQYYTSDIFVEDVVNKYVGVIDNNAIEIAEAVADDVEITQTIKVTTSNVIIASSNLQERTVTPTKEEQVVLAEDGFDGMSKVIVKPVSLEEKTVVPSKEVQTLNPSDSFVGFSQVTVEKIPEEYIIPNGNLDIKNNGDFDVTENATVNVNVQPSLQEKTINVGTNETIEIVADDEYYGLSKAIVSNNQELEQIEITPTKETQVIMPSENKLIDEVTINAIPDNYIEPSGEMEITENGQYDVTDKASVNVATPGVDINEYYTAEYENGRGITQTQETSWYKSILKLPPLSFNGTTCSTMFYYCPAQIMDLSNFDTSNVTNMQRMFMSSSKLTALDLSSFNTSNVTDMNSMFSGCSKLTSLNVSSFNTSNVTNMNTMFGSCSTLTELDVSNFDTSNVTNMGYMFSSCSRLTSLNLSSFDMSNVTYVANMFNYCSYLQNLQFGYNLGKGYTEQTANKQEYKLNLSTCKLLTHDSLMSVINGLYDLNLTYDVANGGTLYTQGLVLGANNLAKLTEEEISIAVQKGWSVS